MKKLLFAIMGVIALALVSCTTTLPAPTNLQIVNKPPYIQKMEQLYPVIITRYENDGKTLWLWVDNKIQPKDCDYVVVYKIIDLEKHLFNLLALFNSETSADPCGSAAAHYEEYLSIMKEFPGSELMPRGNET